MLKFLVASVCYLLGALGCQRVNPQPRSLSQVRRTSSVAPMIRVSFPVDGPVDFTAEDTVAKLHVLTSPFLQQGVDFKLYSLSKENSVPSEILKRNAKRHSIGLLLLPGKSWIRENSLPTDANPVTLYVTAVHYCSNGVVPSNLNSSTNSTRIPVAHIVQTQTSCPKWPSLPGAGEPVNQLVTKALAECRMPRIFKSSKLDWRKVSSFSLLTLQPPLLLIDGSDQSLEEAAKAVDRFIAPHAVLEVVWEPYTEDEPRYWVLMPRPQGMPGHLLAMIDTLQWRHPHLTAAEKYKAQPLCNHTLSGCVPGCPKTKIAGITGSGWGADTGHIVEGFLKFLSDFEPMQVSPFKLGHRPIPPLWGGTIGWKYTYEGCESHFLDCYFLDHSPCPRINLAAWTDPGLANVDKKRFSTRTTLRNMDIRPDWWNAVMGTPSAVVPAHSIQDLKGRPVNQMVYAYFFRPKYDVRKIVHERIQKFTMNEECAVMHVRRGDSILHTGQARAYVKVHTYVKAGRALMDAFGIRHIFLVTDSQGAIDEAIACSKEYPDICGGITFRFLDKKRWVGAEGGWENPFPSGSARVEFLDIQTEFAMAQKCSMAIIGDSNYAQKIMSHMCCGSPLSQRGDIPHRCLCPPFVRVEQSGFDCKKGNELMCPDSKGKQNDWGKLIRLGANYSLGDTAFMQTTRAYLHTEGFQAVISNMTPLEVKSVESEFVEKAKAYSCAAYDGGPRRRAFCRDTR